MEKEVQLCSNCSNPLNQIGFFCGICLTQFKCKSCDSHLEKNSTGCIICGTPKINSVTTNSASQNTFRVHETLTERTIESTFSDNVGKELSGILKDAFLLKLGNNNDASKIKIDKLIDPKIADDFQEFEDINSELEDKLIQKEKTNTSEIIYPPYKSIAIRNLPSSESEWVIVYCFYASKYGEDYFTRQNIIEEYESSKRLDDKKKNGLSSYLQRAIQASLINPINEENFSILELGIIKAKEIISRTTGSSPKLKNKSNVNKTPESSEIKSKSSKSKKANNLKKLTNINFEPEEKESLKSVVEKFSPTNNFERYLLFTFYLAEILEINSIDYNHIYTCFDNLELPVSENLPQTLRNSIAKKGWLELNNGLISVTVKGSNQIKAWKKSEK